MKSYPSISKEIDFDTHVYCFNKYDGSNIRAEYNSKRGFYKFGTRHHLIDEKSQSFGVAISLIKEKYEKDLNEVFKKYKWDNVVCFFELWGEESFAGNHNFEKILNITLIDVNVYKKGILPPKQFIEYFGHLDIAKVLYEGRITKELVDQIKQSSLPGMHLEGIVAKGNIDPKTKMPVMFKIKSQAWLDKLKDYCKDDEQLFKQLS